MKKIGFLPLSIFLVSLFVTNIFAEETADRPGTVKPGAGWIYDLVYRAYAIRDGKIFFVRYRNPLLDPVLRTYEIYMFDPATGQISFLQHPQEMLYILPVLSRDRTTMSYHSLIEGTDYLVTANLQTGRSVRLRFDTGGYFVRLGIDYDDDTVAASIKRGENRQALYLISNSRGSIRRVLEGKVYRETGFLSNGNVYFVELQEGRQDLGFVNVKTRERHIVADGVGFVRKTPNGDAILYARKGVLSLYRPYGNDSIRLLEDFTDDTPEPLISPDGSTCAVIGSGIIYIVNIPSGDVLYYLSLDTRGLSCYLTDFSFYIVRENKIFFIEHKKPGGSLKELYEAGEKIQLWAVSRNDSQIYYQHGEKNVVITYDRRENKTYRSIFEFDVERIIVPEADDSYYLIARVKAPEYAYPVRELYYYHFKAGKLLTVSTARDVDVRLYLNEETDGPPAEEEDALSTP
jgi:hypothetical protein